MTEKQFIEKYLENPNSEYQKSAIQIALYQSWGEFLAIIHNQLTQEIIEDYLSFLSGENSSLKFDVCHTVNFIISFIDMSSYQYLDGIDFKIFADAFKNSNVELSFPEEELNKILKLCCYVLKFYQYNWHSQYTNKVFLNSSEITFEEVKSYKWDYNNEIDVEVLIQVIIDELVVIDEILIEDINNKDNKGLFLDIDFIFFKDRGPGISKRDYWNTFVKFGGRITTKTAKELLENDEDGGFAEWISDDEENSTLSLYDAPAVIKIMEKINPEYASDMMYNIWEAATSEYDTFRKNNDVKDEDSDNK